MSLEELENMENGSSEEYEEDDYPEKRYAKRSAQASETVNSSIVLNNRGERRIRPTPVTVQDDVAEAPLAKPLRVPILRTHSNVAKVIKLVETDRDDSSTMPSLQVENNPAKVEENLIQGCFTQKINRRLMNFEEKSVTSNTIDGCTTQCINENSFLCLSANYDTETKKCILNGGSASINEVMIIEMPNFIYLENKCVAKNENSKVVDVSTVIKHLPKLRQCFRIRENAVLFELQGTVVESAKTLSDCLLVCGQSRKLYRTACISVNWFKLTNQCYIHSATSHTSQLQNSDATDFYKNICFESDFVADDEPVRTIDTLYDDNNTA